MKKKIVLAGLVLLMAFSSACGKNNTDNQSEQKVEKVEKQKEPEKKEEKKEDKVHMTTDYIPDDYRDGYFIVRKSEETALYGLIDSKGDVVIEPIYDQLYFTTMNKKTYLRADFEGKMGILKLNGKEQVKCQYADIVSTGNIGWLAEKEDKKQVLLDEKGNVTKELQRRYTGVLGDKYLYETGRDFLLEDEEYGEIEMGADYYDLDENLLKASEGEGFVCYYTGVENLFFRNAPSPHEDERFSYLQLFEMGGEDIVNVGLASDIIIDVTIDEKLAVIMVNPVGLGLKDNKGKEDYLTKGLEKDKICYLDLNTKKFVDYKPESDKGVFEEVGNFQKVTNEKGEELVKDKIQKVYSFDYHHLIENVDGETALIDDKGNFLIPFGTELRIGQGEFYYNGEEVRESEAMFEAEESFGFCFENDKGQYECFGFDK